MSGIAGIIRTDGRPVAREDLARMARALAHRGPDGEGLWLEPGAGRAGLAARHLALGDPAGARQPVSSEDGSVWLVADGAIYNARDLRADLAARGHALATAGDLETLVHLYEEHGPDLLDRLVGAFALAVWDGPRGRLLLARDRLGQAPLYWWRGAGALVFASEAAALLECPEVPRRPDPRALGAFLRFGYVAAPATGFAGVQKLPPAHYLVFDAATGRLDGPRRWWDIPRGPAESGRPAAEWRERLLAALAEAVRLQRAADVPVGMFLSGGIDSSALVALAAEQATEPLRTFTVSFGAPGWDETAYARAVAAAFGTRHTEVPVGPASLDALEDLVRRQGEPFADSSAVAVYHLARAARREVAIALSGDGGDELLGGYSRHAALIASERLPRTLRRVLAALGRRLPPGAGRKSRWNAARRFLAPLDLDPLRRYLAWRMQFSEADLAALLAPDFAREALADDPLDAWRQALRGLDARPWVDRAMAIDLADYLPYDGLPKVDAAASAHGLAVRSPFLDHRVVELARRMPADLKWRRRCCRMPQGKAILRDILADRKRARGPPLPDQTWQAGSVSPSRVAGTKGDLAGGVPVAVLARGKMGFGVPVSDWLAGERAPWMRGILLDPAAQARGLFAPAGVARLIDDHTQRRADHGERLWALVCLELWFRAFLAP